MRIVFCGTPQFAVPCLEAVVAAGHDVALVLAQPDRPAGRGMKMAAPAVKLAAEGLQIPIMQPEKIKANEELRARLREIAPDVIAVVAYGRILPQWMLDLPKFGCVNVHASLLPKYRGAAPIQWALANGDVVTGVTTMQMDAGLDTGDMLLREELAIEPKWRAPELAEALSHLGAKLLVATLNAIAAGTAHPTKQNSSEATYAPLLRKEDGRVDWTRQAEEIRNRWRAFYPWPGTHTLLGEEVMQIRELRLASEFRAQRDGPGTFVVNNGRWFVACGDAAWLELMEVQMAGRRAVSATEFLRGNTLAGMERLG